MAKMGIDNRSAVHEGFRQIDNSTQRLLGAMERTAKNPRDAGTLSKDEFSSAILNHAGSAAAYKDLDAAILSIAEKLAGAGQIGAEEINKAGDSLKGGVRQAARGDAFLSDRDATTSNLKAVVAAVRQAEVSAAAQAKASFDPKKQA